MFPISTIKQQTDSPTISNLFNLPPEQFTVLSTTIGLSLCKKLTTDQQNTIGNFFQSTGQTILTLAGQSQYLQSVNSSSDSDSSPSDSTNSSSDSDSSPSDDVQSQIKALQQQLDEFKKVIEEFKPSNHKRE